MAMNGERVRFKVTNDMDPEKLDIVVAHFEEIFQQHGLEVSTMSTKIYGTNVKIKGGDIVHADVGLTLDVTLKYATCTCRAIMQGFFIHPGKWKNKLWKTFLVDEHKKMTTMDLIKHIKKHAL